MQSLESLSIVWCGLGVSVAPPFEPSTSDQWISNATTSTASSAAAAATIAAATDSGSDADSISTSADPGSGEGRFEKQHHF